MEVTNTEGKLNSNSATDSSSSSNNNNNIDNHKTNHNVPLVKTPTRRKVNLKQLKEQYSSSVFSPGGSKRLSGLDATSFSITEARKTTINPVQTVNTVAGTKLNMLDENGNGKSYKVDDRPVRPSRPAPNISNLSPTSSPTVKHPRTKSPVISPPPYLSPSSKITSTSTVDKTTVEENLKKLRISPGKSSSGRSKKTMNKDLERSVQEIQDFWNDDDNNQPGRTSQLINKLAKMKMEATGKEELDIENPDFLKSAQTLNFDVGAAKKVDDVTSEYKTMQINNVN